MEGCAACVMIKRLDLARQLHGTAVAGTRCAIDDKFYSVLVRGCVQERQPQTAVDVVCAVAWRYSLLAPTSRGCEGEEADEPEQGKATETLSFGS